MMEPLDKLQGRLGHWFEDISLLERALTPLKLTADDLSSVDDDGATAFLPPRKLPHFEHLLRAQEQLGQLIAARASVTLSEHFAVERAAWTAGKAAAVRDAVRFSDTEREQLFQLFDRQVSALEGLAATVHASAELMALLQEASVVLVQKYAGVYGEVVRRVIQQQA